MKPLACTLAAAAYARTVSATTPMLNRPDEPDAARRMNWPPAQPTARPIAAPAPSSATALSASVQPALGVRGVGRPRGEGGHEDDDRGVVEAGLGLEHAGDPAGERHPAQHGEHRRGVGRGEDRADEQGGVPVEVQHEARSQCDDGHRHDDPDGRQHGGRADRAADAVPPRAETALAEDQDERGVAEHLGELVGVEPDLDERSGLADGQPDARGRSAARAARTSGTAAPRRPRRAARASRSAAPA